MQTSKSYPNSHKLARALPYAAAVALGVGVYIRAAAGPFIWDDNFLLEQLRHVRGSPLVHLFSSGFMQRPAGGADYYRPLVTASLLLDYRLWGANPVGFHLTNLLLHAASILLVARFAGVLIRSRAAAISAAFLFAVHPAHAESVCWISGRTDIMCTLFLVGALSLFLAWRSSKRRWMLGVSCVLLALALLSKEVALVMPILAALAVWASGERGVRRAAVEAIPFAAVAVAYLAVRTWVLYGTEPLAQPLTPLHRAATIGYSAFTHFQILILPNTARLCYEVVMQEIADADTFLALGSLVVLAWFLWSSRRRWPVPFFGMAWFLVTVLPVAALAGWQLSTIVSARFLYLPSVGLAVVFGWAAGVLGRPGAQRAVGAAVGAAVIIAFSALSVGQSTLWTNEVTFWEQFTRDTPTIGWSYYHLGQAYHRAGRYDRALKAYQAAAELMPERPEPDYGSARTYEALGQSQRAVEHYLSALERSPGDPTIVRRLDRLRRTEE